MPRPKIDVEGKRTEVLNAAEALIEQFGPGKVTMQDISRACGMSQSNIYRFFANKDELMGSLADRWFDEVETRLAKVMASERPAWEKFETFVRVQFETKRDRFDENPRLFVDYLQLAMNNMDAVATHVQKLNSWLATLVVECVPGASESLVALVADITIKFRDPHLISAHREECTDERLEGVLAAVRAVLASEPAR